MASNLTLIFLLAHLCFWTPTIQASDELQARKKTEHVFAFVDGIKDATVKDVNEKIVKEIDFGSLMLCLRLPVQVVIMMFQLLQESAPRDGGQLRCIFHQIAVLAVQLDAVPDVAIYDPECSSEQREELHNFIKSRNVNVEPSSGKVAVSLYLDINRRLFDENPKLASQISARLSLRILSCARSVNSTILDGFENLQQILNRVEARNPETMGNTARSAESPDSNEAPSQRQECYPTDRWFFLPGLFSTAPPTQRPAEAAISKQNNGEEMKPFTWLPQDSSTRNNNGQLMHDLPVGRWIHWHNDQEHFLQRRIFLNAAFFTSILIILILFFNCLCQPFYNTAHWSSSQPSAYTDL